MLAPRYGRRPGGRWPGGWWFATEVEIQFTERDLFRPDTSGWRRERLGALPGETPIVVLPDWVCEILSPSNTRHDLVKKFRNTIAVECPITGSWIP